MPTNGLGVGVAVGLASGLPDAGPEIAVVDIWRIDDGLIAEGWEIIEPVAQVAANLVWWESAQH